MKRKDSELVKIKIENEKKISKILKFSEKKNKLIEESQVLNENKFVKEVLVELKS